MLVCVDFFVKSVLQYPIWSKRKVWNKKRIVFLEGLPGVGKTTLTKFIRENFKNIQIVDELLTPESENSEASEFVFMHNDDLKVNKAASGMLLIDRGPISTLSYNQTRHITDCDFQFNLQDVEKWFSNYIDMYKQANVFVFYLTNNQSNYYIPFDKPGDPYGSITNQRLLETITLFNCKKYAKNLIVKEYHKNGIEGLANEVINKLMRS